MKEVRSAALQMTVLQSLNDDYKVVNKSVSGIWRWTCNMSITKRKKKKISIIDLISDSLNLAHSSQICTHFLFSKQ